MRGSPATEEDWLRREQHRRAGIMSIKRHDIHYEALAKWETTNGRMTATERPVTPDPLDRSYSKRQWERRMQQWRICLKSFAESIDTVEALFQELELHASTQED